MTAIRAQDLDLEAFLPSEGASPAALRPFDAKSACIVGEFLITSPNTDFIPLPQWTPSRVRIRSDFRYGADDYTLWPQAYISEYCHLGAILRKPSDPSDPLSIMWWDPSRDDFIVNPGSLYDAFGTLAPPKYALFQELCSVLSAQVREFVKTQKEPNPTLLSLLKSMEHAYLRLEWCPSSYIEMRFSVTELQRYYLEVRAFHDYLTIYKPRMDGLQTSDQVARCIGAFTTTPRVVQDFVDAGLPVYFVRPAVSTLTAASPPLIHKIIKPEDPITLLQLSDADPPFPVVYNGPTNMPMKHAAMHRYSRTWMVYRSPYAKDTTPVSANPFLTTGVVPNSSHVRDMAELLKDQLPQETLGETAAIAGPSTPRLASQDLVPVQTSTSSKTPVQHGAHNRPVENSKYLVSNTKKDKVQHSKSQGTKDTASTKKQRDPFGKYESTHLCPLGDHWLGALTKVNHTNQRLARDAKDHAEFRLYALPDPHLMVTPEKEQKRIDYLIAWIRLRPATIHLLKTELRPFQRGQMWRDLLELVGRNSGTNTTSRGAGYRLELQKVFQSVLSTVGAAQPASSTPPVTYWRQHSLSSTVDPPLRIFHEVTWELSEINFRIELSSLDRRLCKADISGEAKLDRVLRCFPDGRLVPDHIPRLNFGLGATNWHDRVPYTLAFIEVLRYWPKAPNTLRLLTRQELDGRFRSESRFTEMEDVALQFYCQMYWNYCGRAPILPRYIQA